MYQVNERDWHRIKEFIQAIVDRGIQAVDNPDSVYLIPRKEQTHEDAYVAIQALELMAKAERGN